MAEFSHLTALPPLLASAVSEACASITHNLNGQKLGRKGRVTRERILAAAIQLIEESDEPLTLARVARKSSLGLTSLYNYFTDLGELLLAILDPVMVTADDEYLRILRDRWEDADLNVFCYEFVKRYHGFWKRHSQLFHMRNALADKHDSKMMQHRINSSRPIIALLAQQMNSEPEANADNTPMASVVMICIERTVTMVTDWSYRRLVDMDDALSMDRYLIPASRLMELAIRDVRSS